MKVNVTISQEYKKRQSINVDAVLVPVLDTLSGAEMLWEDLREQERIECLIRFQDAQREGKPFSKQFQAKILEDIKNKWGGKGIIVRRSSGNIIGMISENRLMFYSKSDFDPNILESLTDLHEKLALSWSVTKGNAPCMWADIF